MVFLKKPSKDYVSSSSFNAHFDRDVSLDCSNEQDRHVKFGIINIPIINLQWRNWNGNQENNGRVEFRPIQRTL